MTKLHPSKGEVWYVQLDPTVGHEQAKTRPCLIVSTNQFNHGKSMLTVVVPITSRNRSNPLHVPIEPPEGGLVLPSVILCDQIRTVSLKRLIKNSIGRVTDDTLKAVEYLLGALLLEH